MSQSQPPPLPHEELFQICKSAIGQSIWAIEMNAEEDGKLVWCVFCSEERMIKKIPKTYRSRPVRGIFCEKPKMLVNKQ